MELSNKLKIMIDSVNVKIPPKMKAIVTHSHSDHFAVMNSMSIIFATKETIDLYSSQLTLPKSNNFISVEFNQKLNLCNNDEIDEKITLIPSGHVLGSASVYIESNSEKLLFSGDIGGKGLATVNNSLTTKKADSLIVEATFGSPEIQFPSREEISLEIVKWSAEVIKKKMNVVLSAGRIGSSQELIKLFNTLTNLRVVTHGDVTAVSEVYRKHGINLQFFDSKSEEGREILKEGEAVIIQSRGQKMVPYFITEHIPCKIAIVTGMASRFQYRNFDASFPLSSHANYNEIIDYIKEVDPERVFTIYGLEKKLAQAINKDLKIPAKPLKLMDQAVEIPSIDRINRAISQPSFLTRRNNDEDVLSTQDKQKRQFTLDEFFKDN